MASLQRIRVVLSGGVGLPGVSTFYSEVAVPSAVADVAAFYDDIKGLMPSTVTATILSSGDVIEDSNGSLVGTWSEGTDTQVQGTSGVSYGAGIGVAVQWNTNGIRNGRRVRGRTFLCPLTSDIFQNDGTIGATPLSTITTAAGILASGGQLRVWSRPSSIPAADGESHSVLNASVADRVTSLRSRRY